jgi:hypothetical protein
MADFYREMLGLKPFPGKRFRFRLGDSVLLLFNADQSSGQQSPPPHGSSWLGHICFRTSPRHYEAWKLRLTTAVVAVIDEIHWDDEWREARRRGRFFCSYDPSGNVLKIADNDIWPP